MQIKKLIPSTKIIDRSQKEIPVRSISDYILYGDTGYCVDAHINSISVLNTIIGIEVGIYLMRYTRGTEQSTGDEMRRLLPALKQEFKKLSGREYIDTINY